MRPEASAKHSSAPSLLPHASPRFSVAAAAAKIREAKDTMDSQEYLERVQEAHADLMRLGEFWKGREQEVFGGRYKPSSVIEPLPGSPEDR